MPLSEREQQILAEIEKNLYAEDPAFARGVRKSAPQAKEFKHLRLGTALFAVGLVLLVTFFVSRLLLFGVSAFGAMVAGIFLMGTAFYSLAAARAKQVKVRTRFARAFEDWDRRFRERYRRR
ncbi:MAG TPA: DUF3040 domain-containing protein [Actinomycetota bacterium]|nr:DUF3040 domain-containing protein [Actinomycetota bacterium]